MFSALSSKRAVLIASCLGFLVVQIDVSVVNVALNSMREAFDANLTGLQWIINSYALAFSALLISGGLFGDKFGVRRVFVIGFCIFTVASMGCAMSSSLSLLITMRVLQGIGAALLLPTSLALIRIAYNQPIQRNTAIAIWGACGGLGMALGPVLGGVILEYLSWQTVFWLNVPIGITTILLTVKRAPSGSTHNRGLDWASQIVAALFIVSLTYALTEISRKGWYADVVVAALIAVVSVALIRWLQGVSSNPLLPKRLARNGMVMSMFFAGAVINFVFFGLLFALSIYFQAARSFDALQTGLAFVPLTAVLAVSSLLSTIAARKAHPALLIVAGFGTEIFGLILLALVIDYSSMLTINIALALIGIGSAFATPSVMSSLMSAVAVPDAGIASGLMSSARQVGGVIGVSVFGCFLAHADTASMGRAISLGMTCCVLLLVMSTALSLLCKRRRLRGLTITND